MPDQSAHRYACLLAVLLVLPARVLVGQAPAPGPLLLPAAIPGGFLGYTFCRNGVAETWIRADVVGTPELEEVLAHEAVHRREAAAFSSCEAFATTLTSARQVIAAEMPAYCAQLPIAVRHGADSLATRRDYVLRISAQAGAMENRLDVRGVFDRACP